MNFVERVRNIILAPQVEWAVIDAEPTDIREIYARYVVPLALVPAVAGFIGGSLTGIGVPDVGTVRVGVAAGLFGAVLQFAALRLRLRPCAGHQRARADVRRPHGHRGRLQGGGLCLDARVARRRVRDRAGLPS